MNLLVHFVIYGHSWCFEIALAYGSCNFEKSKVLAHFENWAKLINALTL